MERWGSSWFCFSGRHTDALRIFKWLALVLFAYVATAFLAQTDWKAALAATLLPREGRFEAGSEQFRQLTGQCFN